MFSDPFHGPTTHRKTGEYAPGHTQAKKSGYANILYTHTVFDIYNNNKILLFFVINYIV